MPSLRDFYRPRVRDFYCPRVGIFIALVSGFYYPCVGTFITRVAGVRLGCLTAVPPLKKALRGVRGRALREFVPKIFPNRNKMLYFWNKLRFWGRRLRAVRPV